MSVLQQIWLASLIMSATAILVLLVLLGLRIRSDRLDAIWKRQRRTVVPLLLGPQDDASMAQLADIMHRLPSRFTALCVELIQMVRGDERERLLRKAMALGVDAVLERELRAGSPRVRLLAAEAMADFDEPQMMSRLRSALRDKSRDVRMAAAIALAERREVFDIPELIALLDLNERMPTRMTFGLFWLLGETNADGVAALLDDPRYTYRVRIPAIEALAASADFSLVPKLVELSLITPLDDISQKALQDALLSFGHPVAESAVRRALRSPIATVRLSAVRAVGRIGLRSLIPELKSLVGDAEWMVRLRSAQSLLEMGEIGMHALQAVAQENIAGKSDAAREILLENGLDAS